MRGGVRPEKVPTRPLLRLPTPTVVVSTPYPGPLRTESGAPGSLLAQGAVTSASGAAFRPHRFGLDEMLLLAVPSELSRNSGATNVVLVVSESRLFVRSPMLSWI